MGYVKQIRTRILQSCSDKRKDPKTFRHCKSRTFKTVVATSRSEYFTMKRITKKHICCLSWSSRENWSADLCQKFPNYPSRPLIMNTIEPEDIIIISETIPSSEQNLVCCAIWMTMILIEPFMRPHKQIFYREQTPFMCGKTERASFITARQRIGSDRRFFLYQVSLWLACWLSCRICTGMSGTIIIFFSAMEVRSAFVNILHTWEAHHILPPSFKLRIFIIPR